MSAGLEHLTCRELVEILTDYLEDVLDPAERAEVERHIVICAACLNSVKRRSSSVDLFGRLAGDDARAPSEALLATFRAWRARHAP